jgi:hypothetical protein
VNALERRYRLLLSLFPAAFRARHQAAMLSTLLDGAAETQRWPRLGEAFDLLRNALLQRLLADTRLSPARMLSQGAVWGLALWLPLLSAHASIVWFLRMISGFNLNANWLELAEVLAPALQQSAVVASGAIAATLWLCLFALGRASGSAFKWVAGAATLAWACSDSPLSGMFGASYPLLLIAAAVALRSEARRARPMLVRTLVASVVFALGYAAYVGRSAPVQSTDSLVLSFSSLFLFACFFDPRAGLALALPVIHLVLGRATALPGSLALFLIALAVFTATKLARRRLAQ